MATLNDLRKRVDRLLTRAQPGPALDLDSLPENELDILLKNLVIAETHDRWHAGGGVDNPRTMAEIELDLFNELFADLPPAEAQQAAAWLEAAKAGGAGRGAKEQ